MLTKEKVTDREVDVIMLYAVLFHLLGALSSTLLAVQLNNPYSLLLIGLTAHHAGQLTLVCRGEVKDFA